MSCQQRNVREPIESRINVSNLLNKSTITALTHWSPPNEALLSEQIINFNRKSTQPCDCRTEISVLGRDLAETFFFFCVCDEYLQGALFVTVLAATHFHT